MPELDVPTDSSDGSEHRPELGGGPAGLLLAGLMMLIGLALVRVRR